MDALLPLDLSPADTRALLFAAAAVVVAALGAALGAWLRGRALNALRTAEHAEWRHERERTASEHAELRAAHDELAAERDRLREEGSRFAARIAALEATERSLEARLREREQERERLAGQTESLRGDNARLREDGERARAEFQERERALNEKIELLQQAERQLTQQFENLANRIFDDKAETFRTRSRESLEALLKPFREQVSNLHADVREASKERHTLQREIERIVTEANNLTRALKADTRQQGTWGEFVLESLLESSGLRRGEEYVTQESHTSDEGGRQRPDVIVRLPEGKDVIIDAKVSLKAYYQHQNADDDADRERARKAHVASVRQHIKALASKRYDALESVRSLDFTLMFMPLEPAYFVALQADPSLVEQAMNERIMIVSPTTLLAVLRTIDNIWRRERQDQNAIEIANRAGRLYDKFVTFAETLDRVGTSIDRARDQHDSAVRLLREGPGNVTRQLEMLRRMGAAASKQLPAGYADPAAGADPDADDGFDSDTNEGEADYGGGA